MSAKKNASKTINLILTITVPILLILLWQFCATHELINTKIMPAPGKILDTWKEFIANGKYSKYLLASLYRFLLGFFLGSVFGLVIGVLMGLSDKINASLSIPTGFLRSIPLVGWIPIAIISLGVGEISKIVLVAIGSFWSVFIGTVDGIKNVDPKYREVAYVLEKSKFELVRKVILPGAVASILTGIREGFSMAWRSIVAAEMVACSSGIGYMISYSREISRPDIMFIGLATVGILGLLLDTVVIKLQDYFLRRQRSK